MAVDFEAHYTVAGYSGVAFYLLGHATEEAPEQWTLDCEEDHEHDEACYLYSEPEEVENLQQVRAVMVGDDREHVVDVDDLTVLSEDGYCRGCGQTGCGHERLEA